MAISRTTTRQYYISAYIEIHAVLTSYRRSNYTTSQDIRRGVVIIGGYERNKDERGLNRSSNRICTLYPDEGHNGFLIMSDGWRYYPNGVL